MGEVEFREIAFFIYQCSSWIKIKKKVKKSEPLRLEIFLKKRNKKEHISTYKTQKIEVNINLH